MSKLGPHFLHTTPNINEWRAAGPVSMKHFGTWGAAQGDALMVGIRAQQPMDAKGFYDSGYNPEEAASVRFNHYRDSYLADANIDVWEFDNELTFETKTGREWYSQYTIANMMLFESIGKKAAIFSFAVGTPELFHWEDYIPALQYARDNGHYLALHEYMTPIADLGVGWNQPAWQEHLRDNPDANFDAWKQANPQYWWGRADRQYPYGWGVLRYRAVYDTILKPLGLDDLPLLITECGCDIISFTPPWWGNTGSWKANIPLWESWGIMQPEAHFADMLMWYDQELQKDPYVKAAHIFTVGSTGVWVGWDISNTATEIRILDHIAGSQEPEPPGPLPAIRILKKPQIFEMTEAENQRANDFAWENFGRTTTHSIDDMIRMLSGGDPDDTYAIVAWPERPSQRAAIAALDAGGYDWIVMPGTDPGFVLAKPVRGIPLHVTSKFNAPRTYNPPYHEGLDLRAINSSGQPVAIEAAATGAVDALRRTDPGGGYGKYVRIKTQHADNIYTVWYAHMSEIAADIQVGINVNVGRYLGMAGNSGNADGIHLHLTVQKIPGGLSGYVVPDVVDPGPLLGLPATDLPGPQPAPPPPPPPPPPGPKRDLLTFMRADPTAWRVVRHPAGNQEDFQDFHQGNVWFMQKNRLYEKYRFDNDFIYLIEDNSPAPADDGTDRFYRVDPGRYVRRHMAHGEVFNDGGHYVQFYSKATCQPHPQNSGHASNNSMVRFETNKLFNAYGQNIRIDEVMIVSAASGGGEVQYFGRHNGKALGRVAWSSSWGESEIVELYFDRTPLQNPPEQPCVGQSTPMERLMEWLSGLVRVKPAN
jgi:murein DD-endopeptidase MepM/ murein hydrolase activator NlpD